MFGLHVADVFVLGLYLVGVTVIGVLAARRIRNIADFFMPRRFGKLMMVTHAFGTGTHSDQAVSVASKSFTNGLSGIWYQWLWLFATPFYWLIAPVMRRFRAITTGDVFAARFSPSVAMLYAVVGMLNLSINIGVMLKGSSAVVDGCTGGRVSANVAIAAMTVMFVIYGMAGGLSAAIITDFIQGILIVVFSFLLLPFVLDAVGGLAGVREQIDNASEMFSLVAPGEIGFFYVIMISVNALVGIVTQPHTMGNCAAGKTEMEGRVGWMCGNFVKRVCTVAWCFTGLAAVAYFSSPRAKPEHPDYVFGLIAADFLPKILPGLLGLFIAAILASLMSSCDSFMIASSGLFTENIYRRVRPNGNEKHYLVVARVSSLVIVAGGVGFAYWLRGVVTGLEIFWKVSAMMGIAFWLGLFWRRTTVAGAWAGTLAGFGVLLFTSRIAFGQCVLWDFHAHLAGKLPAFMVWEGKLYIPWQMVFYLSIGLSVNVLVSLFSRPVPKEQLDNFYALVRTPVRRGEKVPVPCTLPEDAVVPERRNIFGNTSLEIPVPTRASIVGFLGGCGCVAAIIMVVYLIAQG